MRFFLELKANLNTPQRKPIFREPHGRGVYAAQRAVSIKVYLFDFNKKKLESVVVKCLKDLIIKLNMI